jgi:hypothetical protein
MSVMFSRAPETILFFDAGPHGPEEVDAIHPPPPAVLASDSVSAAGVTAGFSPKVIDAGQSRLPSPVFSATPTCVRRATTPNSGSSSISMLKNENSRLLSRQHLLSRFNGAESTHNC